MRNIVAKLPADAIAEVGQAARAAYQAPSPAMARALRDDLVDRFERTFPSAVQCFLEDFEACIAHLQLPATHRKRARTTNLLERLFLRSDAGKRLRCICSENERYCNSCMRHPSEELNGGEDSLLTISNESTSNDSRRI
jgi:transposase-like protein